ncbi:MAG: hypothetical protein F4034_00555 [Chloroflexi bacterium]|nr:hypothetical protein [Chloroflexota bacterium]
MPFITPSVAVAPPLPGTYLIVARPPLNGHNVLEQLRTPLYVGHTQNLRRRMREHLKRRAHLFLTFGTGRLLFCYSTAPTVPIARTIEQSLISAFGPPDNSRASIRVVAGAPIPAGRPLSRRTP